MRVAAYYRMSLRDTLLNWAGGRASRWPASGGPGHTTSSSTPSTGAGVTTAGLRCLKCCKPRCRAVNTFVCYSLAILGLVGDVPDTYRPADFSWHGNHRRKILAKPRKNRGQSESSPRCLNAVNPAVGLSAPKYYLPGQTPVRKLSDGKTL
jgi:hypothetical protein